MHSPARGRPLRTARSRLLCVCLCSQLHIILLTHIGLQDSELRSRPESLREGCFSLTETCPPHREWALGTLVVCVCLHGVSTLQALCSRGSALLPWRVART